MQLETLKVYEKALSSSKAHIFNTKEGETYINYLTILSKRLFLIKHFQSVLRFNRVPQE
ncbi:MAG: hypothetical protein QXX85_05235 [Candidatus Nitrosotenuis sp.]